MVRQSQPRFLLTRPQPQSARFARDLVGEVVISPLMRTEVIPVTLPDTPFAAVVFTSETGVAAAQALGLALPRLAYCVGARTALAAQGLGLEVKSADGDMVQLAALIRQERPDAPLLILRAEQVAGDLAADLNSAGLETFSAVIYRQNACPLNAEAVALLQQEVTVGVPLFSARSAQLFVAEYLRIGGVARLLIAAMSPAVVAALELSPQDIEVAAQPDAASMLAALREVTLRGLGS